MSLSHCLKVSCRHCFFCGLMALGLLLGLAGHAKAQPTYVFTTLDVPGSSFPNSTFANGINASGQIVGGFFSTGPNSHGFLLDNGGYTTLDAPGSFSTSANGINASAQIVGSYYDVAGHGHGFLFDQGSYTTLDVPGSTYTRANGINDSGQIVGDYIDAGGTGHGFLLDTVATPHWTCRAAHIYLCHRDQRLGPNCGTICR
jgi:probable HAF family extracellular repeat protein